MGMTSNGAGALNDRRRDEELHRPAPRQAKALRILLGLSIADAARIAKISVDVLHMVEAHDPVYGQAFCPSEREAVSAAYASIGGRWLDHELHDDHLVYLEAGGAPDLRAINAALALMGHCQSRKRPPVTVAMLATRVQRRAGIPKNEVRRALAGKMPATPLLIAECFHQLRYSPNPGHDCAGCQFMAAENGGWWGVRCDWRGCWW